ncbi:MAG: diguanylate cyclase [Propionibacteriales bacterium]|nr:diguanylate cyclase [Propionibacteriales bacterium]
MARRLVRAAGPTLGFVVAYVLAVQVGRASLVEGSEIALAWPAAAVEVLWALYASARSRRTAALHAAAFFVLTIGVSVSVGVDVATSLWFSGVHLTFAVVTTFILRYGGRPVALRQPPDLTRLFVAVSVGALVASTLAVAFLSYQGDDDPGQTFTLFAVRNGVTALAGVAVALRVRDFRWRTPSLQEPRTLEAIACAAVTTLVFARIFWFNIGLPTGFVMVLPAIWIALRFSTAASTVFVTVTGTFIVWSTLLDHGPLHGLPAQQQAFLAQGTVLTLTLVALTLALFRDSRNELIAELRHLALHDPLTGLANRTLFIQQLDVHLDSQRAVDAPVGVIFLDLDGFKLVNDAWGHREGDLLLHEMARRIKAAIRPADLAARLGGDEFVVACTGLSSTDELHEIAERIRLQIAAPYGTAADAPFDRITASIGYALSDRKSTSKALLSAADRAMYQAKRAGRNQTAVLSQPLSALDTMATEPAGIPGL